jgi:hypothetical protein
MTTVQSPKRISGSSPNKTSHVFAPATDPSSAGASDLIYAYALLEAIEIMQSQPNVNTLLSVAADYGTTIISADGIAIIHGMSGRWRPVIVREIVDEPDVAGVHQVVQSLAADGWLQQYRRVDDLDRTADGMASLLPVTCEPGGRFSSCPQSSATTMHRPSCGGHVGAVLSKTRAT